MPPTHEVAGINSRQFLCVCPRGWGYFALRGKIGPSVAKSEGSRASSVEETGTPRSHKAFSVFCSHFGGGAGVASKWVRRDVRSGCHGHVFDCISVEVGEGSSC